MERRTRIFGLCAAFMLVYAVTIRPVYGTDLIISGNAVSNGLDVVVHAPDGFTNRVEIYACSNLVSGTWHIAAQNLRPMNDNPVHWSAELSGTWFFCAGNMDIDSDSDGLSDAREKYVHKTDPLAFDSDTDGLPDGWEVGHGSSPRNKSDGLSDPDGDGLNNLEAYQTRPIPSVDDTDGDGFCDACDLRINEFDYPVVGNLVASLSSVQGGRPGFCNTCGLRINEFDYPVVGTASCNLVASSWYLSPVLIQLGFGSRSEQLLTLYWSANFYYPPRSDMLDGLCVSPGSSQLRWQGISIPGNNGLELYGVDEYYEDYWFYLNSPLWPFWQPQLPGLFPSNLESDSLHCHPSDLEREIMAYAYSQPLLCCPTNGNGFLYSRSREEYTYGEDGGVIATQTYYYCIVFSREASEPQPPTSLQYTDTMVATGGALQSYGHPYDPYDHGQSVFKFVFNQPVTNRVVKWLTYNEIHQDTIFGNHAVHQCEVTGRESGLFKSTDQYMIVPAVDLNGDFDSDGDVDIDDTILRAPASASLPIVPAGQTNEMPGSGVVLVTVDANFFSSGMPASTLKLKFSGVDSGEHFRLWSTTDIVPQEPASMMVGMTMAGSGGALRGTTNTVPQEPAPGIVPMMASGGRERQLIVDIPLLIDTEAGLEHDWPVEEHYDYSPPFPKTLYLECLSCGATNDGKAKLELTYEYNGEEICATALPITVIRSKLVPDWNHDRSIDMADQNQDTNNAPFRFWINDDKDNGDISEGDSDVPGQSGKWNPLKGPANHEDNIVNGRSDLLDFFPVWLDIGTALSNYPPGNGVEYRLSQADEALKFVYTDLANTNAGDYIVTDIGSCGPGFNQNAREADTVKITAEGIVLRDDFINRIATNPDKGILMMEAVASSTAPLVLEIWRGDNKEWEASLALSLSGVEDMYRKVNLRNMQNPGALTEPSNNPDAASNGTNLVFLHGYQPDAGDSGDMSPWLSEMFKRFYQSGSKAKFHGVLWYSNQGDPIDYQKNVTNAFCTAPVLRDYVAGLDGDVVVAAHSLGNMVVSSAIADQNMSVSKYMMCDAAVASEAYDATMPQDNNLVNEWWTGYSNRTWAANWYLLFADTGDSRERLTWRDRFSDVVNKAWNFYSTGDEVFDLTSNQGLFTGTIGVDANWWFIVPVGVDVNVNFGRYSWQKQELFKGCRYSDDWTSFGGTRWAGWGVESELQLITWHGLPAFAMVQPYTDAAGANMATDEQLRSNPVFEHTPSWLVGTGVLSQAQIDQMLGMGFPALTMSTGRSIIPSIAAQRQLNLNDTAFKPNGWPTAKHSQADADQWLHNDMKDVAYFYNHKLFDKMAENGGLK